jgi:ABC-type phosphate/phosphonate transport system substrate-binding protein
MVLLSWGMVMGLLPSLAVTSAPGQPLQVGVVTSLFHNRSQSVIEKGLSLLQDMMETQTGLRGRVQTVGKIGSLGKMLQERQMDLALLHGFEFAWVKGKYPDLVPLLLVSNPRPLRACLVTRKDSKIASIQELKDQYVAVPIGSRGHCHLFLERRCCPADQKPEQFFKAVSVPIDVTHALEDVCDEVVAAAVVERGGFEDYCQARPKRAAQLKVLVQSEIFPPGVIAYHPRKLPAEIVRRLREGLLNAHQTKEGKDLLDQCRMTGFEEAPADFGKSLQDIAKSYPEPDTQ